jgi:hypothetical protein
MSAVHFYFHDTTLGTYWYLGSVDGNLATFTDTSSGPEGRVYTWTLAVGIGGDAIPAGPIDLVAIGVDSGANASPTPTANTNVTIVDGTILY